MPKRCRKQNSKSATANLTATFVAHINQWRERALDSCYLAVYIDAIHLKVKRATVLAEAFYMLMEVKSDST